MGLSPSSLRGPGSRGRSERAISLPFALWACPPRRTFGRSSFGYTVKVYGLRMGIATSSIHPSSGAKGVEGAPLLEVQDLTAVRKNGGRVVEVFRGLTFKVPQGGRLVVIGRSGSGKTTLLWILSGLLRPKEGVVKFCGSPLQGPREEIAIIFQHGGLLPWKTVMENVTLGLSLRRMGRRERAEAVEGLLERLGISHLTERLPRQLSGGERQRVAIARALAQRPKLLLLDEPFASLDALTREDLQDLLVELWLSEGMAMVLVTHSVEEAAFLGDEALVLGSGRGELIPLGGKPGREYRRSPTMWHNCNRLREALKRSCPPKGPC